MLSEKNISRGVYSMKYGIYIYRISLNIGPGAGVYFLPVSFDQALKRGRRLTGQAFIMYNSIQFNYYCHGGPTWALTKRKRKKKKKEAAEQCTCKHVAMRV